MDGDFFQNRFYSLKYSLLCSSAMPSQAGGDLYVNFSAWRYIFRAEDASYALYKYPLIIQ